MTAAVAILVMSGVAAGSEDRARQLDYHEQQPMGWAAVHQPVDLDSGMTRPWSIDVPTLVGQAVPGHAVGGVFDVMLASDGGPASVTTTVTTPACSINEFDSGQEIPDCRLQAQLKAVPQALLDKVELTAVQRKTLREGGVVNVVPEMVQRGEVAVMFGSGSDDAAQSTRVAVRATPGMVSGFQRTDVVISAEAARTHHWPLLLNHYLITGPVTPQEEQRLNLLLGDPISVERGFRGDSQPVIWTMLGLTALLVAVAALGSTALAMIEQRPDLTTLRSIGAPPRISRAIAAAHAALVGGLGVLLGVLAGMPCGVAFAYLNARPQPAYDSVSADGPSVADSWSLVIPWWMLLVLMIAVPMVNAGLAWLMAGSRAPLTRRQFS